MKLKSLILPPQIETMLLRVVTEAYIKKERDIMDLSIVSLLV